MKKFLLSLVGLFALFNANADRYWIHGQIFGDSGWGSVELIKNEATGKYEKIGKLVTGDFGVKVTDDAGNQTAWYCAPEADYTINEAGTYPIQSNDSKNYTSNLVGNYTISLDWASKKITFEPYSGEIVEGPASYVLRGDCFGGSWDDREMTEANGLWTWTGKVTSGTAGKSLGIKKMVDGIQKGWYWAPTTRPGIISDAGLYYVVLQDGENGKNLTTKVNGEFTFTFNPQTLELKVAGENIGGNDFDDEKWYFVGQRTGWDAKEAYELTAGENGEYVLDADWTMDPTKPFKFNNGNFDDDLEFGAQSEENNKVEVGVPYTLGGKGAGDLFVKESIKNPHIVLNPTTGILTITSRGGDDPVVDPTELPELYLTGSFQTNPWTLGAARYKFTREDNIYTLEFNGTLKTTDEFKIADNDWDDDIDFGANDAGDKIEDGVAYTTVQNGYNNNLRLAENLKNPKFVFNYSTLQLTVTGEAVEVVDPIDPTDPSEYVYYIYGDIFASAEWTSVKLTANDGKYVLANKEVEAGKFGIRVVDPTITTGEAQVAWYAATSAEAAQVTLGSPIAITNSDPVNFEIKKGVYTFTLDMETKTLTVVGQEVEDVDHKLSYRIRGTLSNEEGAAWKDYAMTEKDGKWSVTVENALVAFGIRTWCSAHNKQFEWVASASEEPVANEAGEYLAKVDGANWTSTLTGKITYTFDPETMTLTIANEGQGGNDDPIDDPVVEEKDYFLVGAFNQWSQEANKFTKKAEDEYTVSVAQLTGDFKVTVGNWEDASWGTNGENITVGTPYVCNHSTGSANITLADIVNNAVVTFVPSTGTITIKGDVVENIVHEYVYHIHGSINGIDWETYDMEKSDDNKWSFTTEKGFKNFVIKKTDKAVPAHEVWIKSDGDGKIGAKGQFGAQIEGTDWESSLLGKCTYIFDPENMVLTVDGSTGVNSIEAEEGDAVYFNLQGQRVANPDKGIYIRVVNGKAVKVVK